MFWLIFFVILGAFILIGAIGSLFEPTPKTFIEKRDEKYEQKAEVGRQLGLVQGEGEDLWMFSLRSDHRADLHLQVNSARRNPMTIDQLLAKLEEKAREFGTAASVVECHPQLHPYFAKKHSHEGYDDPYYKIISGQLHMLALDSGLGWDDAVGVVQVEVRELGKKFYAWARDANTTEAHRRLEESRLQQLALNKEADRLKAIANTVFQTNGGN